MMSLILLSFLCLSRKTNLLPISYCRDDPTSSTKDWFNDILVTMCKKQYLEVVSRARLEIFVYYDNQK